MGPLVTDIDLDTSSGCLTPVVYVDLRPQHGRLLANRTCLTQRTFDTCRDALQSTLRTGGVYLEAYQLWEVVRDHTALHTTNNIAVSNLVS